MWRAGDNEAAKKFFVLQYEKFNWTRDVVQCCTVVLLKATTKVLGLEINEKYVNILCF